MVFKTIAAIILIIIILLSSVWLIKGIQYSYKVQNEVGDEEVTCYFDRGFIRTPFVRICKTDDRVMIIKKDFFEE